MFRLVRPMVAEVEFGNRCNLECDFCKYPTRSSNTAIDTVKLLDFITENDLKAISIGGGDPFLNPELGDFTAALLEKGVRPVITTNGTNITEKLLEKINHPHLVIRVEVLSTDPAVYGKMVKSEAMYQRMLEGLRLVKKSAIHLAQFTPMLPENLDEVDEIIEFCVRYSIQTINFSINPFKQLDQAKYLKALTRIIELVKKHNLNLLSDLPLMSKVNTQYKGVCPAGRVSLYIDRLGDVHPCRYMNYKIGNIYKENIDELWGKELWSPIIQIPDMCQSCQVIYSCGGGCPANRYIQFGDLRQRDPLCGGGVCNECGI